MFEIKGFLESSLIEWDGKITSVIFLPGCNFKCPWCHVPALAFHPEELETVPFQEVEEYIRRQKDWLDGVVISGGEPTIHISLPEFIGEIKDWGIPVKLETNGSNPDILRELIEGELIDAVAMDIKNTVKEPQCSVLRSSTTTEDEKGKNSKYAKTVGVPVDPDRIKESIGLIMKSRIEHEFRTTVVPGFLNEEEVEDIARSIKTAKKYVLQQFVPTNAYMEEMTKIEPYSRGKLDKMAKLAGAYVEHCILRGV